MLTINIVELWAVFIFLLCRSKYAACNANNLSYMQLMATKLFYNKAIQELWKHIHAREVEFWVDRISIASRMMAQQLHKRAYSSTPTLFWTELKMNVSLNNWKRRKVQQINLNKYSPSEVPYPTLKWMKKAYASQSQFLLILTNSDEQQFLNPARFVLHDRVCIWSRYFNPIQSFSCCIQMVSKFAYKKHLPQSSSNDNLAEPNVRS